MKKVSLFAIGMTCVLVVFGATSAFISAANSLAQDGYIVDHSDDVKKYELDKPILRQEAIGIITKVNGLVNWSNSTYVCKNKFRDVSKKDGWVCYVAEKAAENNVVNAKNTTFRPKEKMTHYEAMVLSLKWSCIQPTDDSSSKNAQQQTLDIALETNLVTNSKININQPITRGEFFYYIVQAQTYKDANPEMIDPSLPGCSDTGETSETPMMGDIVSVHYVGTLDNGEQFDSSRETGEPLEFIIGKKSMISWFEEAIRTMKIGEKKNIRLEPKDAYGEEYIEETMSLSEYQKTMTQSIPVNALTGKLEQTVSKSQAESMFGSLTIGSEKKIGEANLKIVSISGDNVIVSINDPEAPFYGKTLSVWMTASWVSGAKKITIKSISGDSAEVEIEIDAIIINQTSTEITLKVKNTHPLAGKALNFEIELLSIN